MNRNVRVKRVIADVQHVHGYLLKRLFYIVDFLVVTLLAALMVSIAQAFFIGPVIGAHPELLGRTLIFSLASRYGIVFWPILVISVGILIRRQILQANGDEKRLETQFPLVRARDIDRGLLKLGDTYAANAPYVTAPVQQELCDSVLAIRDAVAEHGRKSGLLVVGISNSGKTRMALEAVRKALPRWPILLWNPTYSLPDLSSLRGKSNTRLILFLDDLQLYLSISSRNNGDQEFVLTSHPALALRALITTLRRHAKHIAIVATCRSEELALTRPTLGWLVDELVRIDVPTYPLEQLARTRGRHRFCESARYASLFDRPERTLGASGG